MLKRQEGSSNFIVILLMVLLIGSAGVFVWRKNHVSRSASQPSSAQVTSSGQKAQVENPVPTLTFNSVDTSGWKAGAKVKPNQFLAGTLRLMYPAGWSISPYKDVSGAANITISAPNNTGCVYVSLSSWEIPTGSFDGLLKRAINTTGDPADYKTTASSRITINSKPGYIAKLTRDGKITVAAIGEIAPEPRYSANKFYATLSSCNESDADVLKAVAETISYH